MSKRCCASSCYNSQTVKNSVHYFGFPKNEAFAHQWLVLAHRTDLLEKPLHKIIKYFLCSEHFTDDCFLDLPIRSKLKRSLRPISYPLPSLFKCNIGEYIPSIGLGGTTEALNNTEDRDEIDEQIGIILRHNAEPSGDILLDVPQPTTESHEPPAHAVQSSAQYPELLKQPLAVLAYEEPPVEGTFDLSGEIIDDETINVIEEVAVDDRHPKDYVIGVFYIDKSTAPLRRHERQSPVSGESLKLAQAAEERKRRESEMMLRTCRLCAELFETADGLMRIFGIDKKLHDDLCLMLPDAIAKDDGLPQQICFMCYTKMIGCVKVIRDFRRAQDKFGRVSK